MIQILGFKRRKDTRDISMMRNLGPAVERDLNVVGIMCAQDIIDLGPEKTFVRMLQGRAMLGRSGSCCNALYLYALYGALHDMDWRLIPADKKTRFKALAAEIRVSKVFEAS